MPTETGTKTYQTTKLTAAAIANITAALETYVKNTGEQYKTLDGAITALLAADVFSGDAANGFKTFYTTKVVPVLTESLPSVTTGVRSILEGVDNTMLKKVDPELQNFNQNPGGAADGAAAGN